MLLDACDETSYMNADGTYRTTQPGGFGNIQVSRHDTTVRMNSEERPTFQVTLRLSAPHDGQRLIWVVARFSTVFLLVMQSMLGSDWFELLLGFPLSICLWCIACCTCINLQVAWIWWTKVGYFCGENWRLHKQVLIRCNSAHQIWTSFVFLWFTFSHRLWLLACQVWCHLHS